MTAGNIWIFFFYFFPENKLWHCIHANCLLKRQFAWNIKAYFLGKTNKKNIIIWFSAKFAHTVVKINPFMPNGLFYRSFLDRPISNRMVISPRGYKTFFMLNSAEHEIFSANKYENANNRHKWVKFCVLFLFTDVEVKLGAAQQIIGTQQNIRETNITSYRGR